MSTSKTPNLSLHRWTLPDNFTMEEFNENFSMLDYVCAGKTSVVTGGYIGSGSTMTVTLGFPPKAVIVKRREDFSTAPNTSQVGYVPSMMVRGYSGNTISLTGNGFTLTNHDMINATGKDYIYLVFR